MEIEIHAVVEVVVDGEALLLLHVVRHGKVAVGGVALREEDCVVEADVLLSRDALRNNKLF